MLCSTSRDLIRPAVKTRLTDRSDYIYIKIDKQKIAFMDPKLD